MAGVYARESNMFETSPSKNRLSRREEIALKKLALLKSEEEQLSFAPKVKPAPRRKSSGGNASPVQTSPASVAEKNSQSDAFSRMYSEARKKQENAKTTVTPSEYSFKPAITSKGSSRERSKSPVDAVNRQYNAHGSGRPVQIEAPKESFRPQISKRAKSLDRQQGISPNERLYSHAQIVKERQDKLRETHLQKEQKDCTFAPAVVSSKNSVGSTPAKPISERMQKYIEDRNRKLEEAKKAKEEKERLEITLKPTILKRDKKEEDKITETKTVFDRLSRFGKRTENVETPSFKPQLVARKRSSSARSAKSDNETCFDRLHKEAEHRRRELAAERDLARQEEERKHTFSPHLSARQQSSSPDNVYDRLSAPKSESETKRRLHPSGRTLFEREIEECTFSPAINPESRLIQSFEPVYERLSNEAIRQRELKKQLSAMRLEEEMQECTFRPNVSHSSSSGMMQTQVDQQSQVLIDDADDNSFVSKEPLAGNEEELPFVIPAPVVSATNSSPIRASEPLNQAMSTPAISPLKLQQLPAGLKPVSIGGLSPIPLATASPNLRPVLLSAGNGERMSVPSFRRLPSSVEDDAALVDNITSN